MTNVIEKEIRGVRVSIACYGQGEDFLCRLTDLTQALTPSDEHDAAYPPADFGYLWFRIGFRLFLVSGMLTKLLWRSPEEVYELVDFVATKLLKIDIQPSFCIELVEARNTHIFNGEEGDIFLEGGGSGARFNPVNRA